MLSVEVVNSGAIPPSHNIKPSHKFTTKPVQTIIVALFLPNISEIKSVHRNVIGYGKTPIATIKGKLNPKMLKLKSINLDVPKIFNIVIDDMKIPANIMYVANLLVLFNSILL